ASISYEMVGLEIHIRVEVHTVYKTGVEVEAMHGASITALTLYDMLKPVDPELRIQDIRLISKKGGKSDRAADLTTRVRAAVIVCSDSVAAGSKLDSSGRVIVDKLKAFDIETGSYQIIADEPSAI